MEKIISMDRARTQAKIQKKMDEHE